MIFFIKKYKILFTICIIHIYTIIYSSFYDYFIYKKFFYCNYINAQKINKIKNGMTKQQIIFTLGSSIIKDNFCYNTMYYIYSCEIKNQYINQLTFNLTFNNKDILIRIEKITFTISK